MDNTPHFDAARRSFLARSLDAADVDAAGTQDEESAARTREFLRGQRHVSQSQLFGDVDDADHHDGPLRPPAGDDDDDDDDDGGYAAAAAAAAAAVLDRLVAHCALLGYDPVAARHAVNHRLRATTARGGGADSDDDDDAAHAELPDMKFACELFDRLFQEHRGGPAAARAAALGVPVPREGAAAAGPADAAAAAAAPAAAAPAAPPPPPSPGANSMLRVPDGVNSEGVAGVFGRSLGAGAGLAPFAWPVVEMAAYEFDDDTTTDLERVVVVTGLPRVRVQHLLALRTLFQHRLFSQLGVVRGVHIPVEADGSEVSKPVAFIEMADVAASWHVTTAIDGFPWSADGEAVLRARRFRQYADEMAADEPPDGCAGDADDHLHREEDYLNDHTSLDAAPRGQARGVDDYDGASAPSPGLPSPSSSPRRPAASSPAAVSPVSFDRYVALENVGVDRVGEFQLPSGRPRGGGSSTVDERDDDDSVLGPSASAGGSVGGAAPRRLSAGLDDPDDDAAGAAAPAVPGSDAPPVPDERHMPVMLRLRASQRDRRRAAVVRDPSSPPSSDDDGDTLDDDASSLPSASASAYADEDDAAPPRHRSGAGAAGRRHRRGYYQRGSGARVRIGGSTTASVASASSAANSLCDETLSLEGANSAAGDGGSGADSLLDDHGDEPSDRLRPLLAASRRARHAHGPGAAGAGAAASGAAGADARDGAAHAALGALYGRRTVDRLQGLNARLAAAVEALDCAAVADVQRVITRAYAHARALARGARGMASSVAGSERTQPISEDGEAQSTIVWPADSEDESQSGAGGGMGMQSAAADAAASAAAAFETVDEVLHGSNGHGILSREALRAAVDHAGPAGARAELWRLCTVAERLRCGALIRRMRASEASEAALRREARERSAFVIMLEQRARDLAWQARRLHRANAQLAEQHRELESASAAAADVSGEELAALRDQLRRAQRTAASRDRAAAADRGRASSGRSEAKSGGGGGGGAGAAAVAALLECGADCEDDLDGLDDAALHDAERSAQALLMRLRDERDERVRVRERLVAREAKDEDDADTRLCVVCLQEPKTVLLLPCRHLCVCQGCSERTELDRCPMCREGIQRVLSVFS